MIHHPATFDLFVPAPAKAPPAPVIGKIPLRWCQREDADALMNAIETGHDRPACVAATGYGKGALIAETVGRLRKNGKVVCLVDRAHLVHQLADEIERHLGSACGRVADGVCDGLARGIVVGTVQAMFTPDRSRRRLCEYPHFDNTAAVVADESHKFFAPAFRGVLEHFRQEHGSVVPMFTATPVASNGAEWSSFANWTPGAEGPAMRTVGWCIRNGYLVSPQQAFVHVDIDLSGIYAPMQDADPDDEDGGDELSELLGQMLHDKGERAAATFAAGVADVIGTRRAIVFSPPRVAAAKLLSAWLSASGRLSCEPIWGSRADKDELLSRFKAGQPQCLSNVNLLCEGFNDPSVSAVFMCRLLKSWRLVQQCVGRALRPSLDAVEALGRLDGPELAKARRAAIARSSKPDALIADLVGLDDQVLQASAVDVLYGAEFENVRTEVAEILRQSSRPAAPEEREEFDKSVLEEARANILRRQHERIAEMARRRAMAGGIEADVSVTYGRRAAPVAVTVPTPKARATPGEKAMFVAMATQYEVTRAMAIADKTPRHQLRGMTFTIRKKLDKEGGRPDWNRARRAYPEWAAAKSRKGGA